MRPAIRTVVLLLAAVGLWTLGSPVVRFLWPKPPALAASEQEMRLADGRAWTELLATLGEVGEEMRASGRNLRLEDQAEGYRHLLRMIAVSVAQLDTSDSLRPRFVRYPNTPTRIGHDNPDNVYLASSIQGDQRYVVYGNLGSTRIMTFNVYAGMLGMTPFREIRTVSTLNSREIETDSDGNFELVLSGSPEPGNWLKLDPDATILIVRQLFSDWESEQEGSIYVRNTSEHLGPAPALTAAAMAQQLDAVGAFVRSIYNIFEMAHSIRLGLQSDNEIPAPQVAPAAVGDPNNQTTVAKFSLEEGTALLIDFPHHACQFTNIELGNMWWEALDYMGRQTHLNDSMTRVDTDGRIRYVVSREDPGVPNWLDTEERLKGTLFMRWTQCEAVPESIRTELVQLSSLREHLPPDTPVVSREQREEALRLRREVISRRYSGRM